MTSNLTEQQKQDIQAAFKQFDKNGDGEISIEELGEAMKAAGQQVTEEALKDMMRAIDYNGDGKAQYKEFETMMATQLHGYTISDEDLKQYFRHFDRNGDGFITADELKAVMRTFGERELTDEEVESMIAEADTNKDNKISIEEFIASLKNKM